MNSLKATSIALTAFGILISYQNCSKSAFNGSSSSSSTKAQDTGGTGTSTDTGGGNGGGGAACSGPLCGISIADINTITFTGVVSPMSGDSFTLSVATKINAAAQTLSSELNAVVSYQNAKLNVASCSSAGTNVDFNAMKSNLEAVTFTTVEGQGSAQYASANLVIVLNDGTVKNLQVDTATTDVSVSNAGKVDASALVEQLTSIAVTSSCSGNIPF